MRRFSLLFAGVVSLGCGSDDTTTQQQPLPAAKPVWTDAPTEPVVAGQGQTVALPLSLLGSSPGSVEVTVQGPTEAGASVSADGGSLLVHPSYTATGTLPLEVVLFDEKGGTAAFPVSLDVRPIVWLGTTKWGSAGPEAREHGAVIVDAEARRAFLLGGSGYNPYGTPLDDAWRYDIDGDKWAAVTPTGDALLGAGSRRVAQIPGEKVAYLFGGYGPMGAVYDDLVRVTFDGDGLVLKILDKTSPWPKPRALHMFVHDAAHERFVLFGGAGSAPLDDTWLLTISGETATWTEIEPPIAPSKRYGFFHGLDEANERVVLFSGAQGFSQVDPARDTWVLDLSVDPPTWQLVLEGEEMGVPPGRRNGCAVFDPTGPRFFVFGGTPDGMTGEPGLFVFDARPESPVWTQLTLASEPDLRSSGFGFFDPVTSKTRLGFGNTMEAVYADWSTIGH